jgi:hypothetical protein
MKRKKEKKTRSNWAFDHMNLGGGLKMAVPFSGFSSQ